MVAVRVTVEIRSVSEPRTPRITVFLARHGQTADNAARIFQGQQGAGLDDVGRAQAARLGARARTLGLTALVASDLQRAVETAEHVAATTGLPLVKEAGFREVDVGSWTGKSYDAIADAYPEEWAAFRAGVDVRRGGGETYAELAERIEGALQTITTSSPDGARVLVVTHGGAIKAWTSRLLALTPAGARAMAPVANGSLTIAERHDGVTLLRSFNDTAHLEGV